MYTIPHIRGERLNKYEMFLSEDGNTVTLFGEYYLNGEKTSIISIDVSDVASPVEKGRVTVSGYKNTVRRIDGKFYLLTNCYYEKNRIDLDKPETFVPSVDIGDEKHICDGDKIIYPDKISNVVYQYLTVFDGDLNLYDEKAMMVSGSPVFTENSIIFEYQYYKSETDGGKSVNRCYSRISVLDISDKLTWRGNFTILGWTENRFSLDEQNGYLRIVTSVSDRAGYRTSFDNVSLYVYDINTLERVAAVEEFAPEGEGATAVRFEGDKLYVCTAEVALYTDPVYFFDLSDYLNISYTHTGFINGFSSSLIDLGEGYLLGVGVEDDARSKLEVYKREGDKVVSVDKFVFYGRIDSDYKSYMINREENLFGIYVSKYAVDDSKGQDAYLTVRLEGEKLVTETTICKSLSSPRAFVKSGVLYLTDYRSFFVNTLGSSKILSTVTDHTFSEWEIISPAPCGGSAEQQRICSCSRIETKQITGEIKHELSEDGFCTLCGDDVGSAEKNSQLLIYTSNGDGTCAVTGSIDFVYGVLEIPKQSPKGEKVIGIGKGAFANNAISSVIIPRNVTYIGENSFYSNQRLEKITIEGSGEASGPIGAAADFFAPSKLTIIGSRAFYHCEALKEIHIPDSVTEIGERAFESCESLKKVTLSKSLTKISTCTFNLCDDLRDVNIPNGITEIEHGAFNQCKNLVFINIPDSVTVIDRQAFGYCDGLVSVVLGSGVTSIEERAFVDCVALVEVVNNSSLTIVAGSSEYGGIALYASQVKTGKSSVVNLDGYIFITTPEKKMLVKYIGSDTQLIIPDHPYGGEYEIGRNAFYRNNDITSVVIPEGVTVIGERAFSQCNALSSITLPESIRVIGDYAFHGTDVQTMTLGSRVESIGNYAFWYCNKLENITLPQGLTTIGNNAFSGCNSLKEINIPSSVTHIGNAAFYACSSITSIVIPDGITTVGEEMLRGCTALESVVIPNSVKVIEDAFYACYALKTINYKGTMAEWSAIDIAHNNGLFDKNTLVINFNYEN